MADLAASTAGMLEVDAESSFETLVLGLGNILWADEGFGVRAVEALHAAYQFPDHVRVMDGGTQGIFLIPWVRSCKRLLILDAIDYGLEPGTLRVIRDDEVPRFMGARKMSMHQAGFQEVLMTAKLSGDFPGQIALVGVQPELLDDYGGSLRPCVKARLDEAVEVAVGILRDWGIDADPRQQPLENGEGVGPHELEMGIYESGRPHIGDKN
ncbi:MAG: HyaD/HybD family hydrogenase maturation endopeptidase [Gammaproteobacteria bacterium]